MIDALIQGKLYGQPTQRLTKAGKPFAVAKLRVATAEGESTFVSVVAFDDVPVAALLALKEGDSVAVTGPLKVGTSYGARLFCHALQEVCWCFHCANAAKNSA